MKAKNVITWIAVVVLSTIFIFVGNKIATENIDIFDQENGEVIYAKITEIISHDENEIPLSDTESTLSKIITFRCEGVVDGTETELIAKQEINSLYGYSKFMKEVEAGDKILLTNIENQDPITPRWDFIDYYRLDAIIILACVFGLLLMIIGRKKGLNTILSLVFTFSFIFFVFVPSIMNGFNIYLSVSITSIFTIVMTLLLTNGLSTKTYATIIGCVGGTLIATIVTVIMSEILLLTGYVDDHSFFLTILEHPVDLTAIIYAAIIIGAIGAIMDVAMDISSALCEMHEHLPNMTFKEMFDSGIQIGRDIMGTMANTLILAYIGGSLSSIILFLTYSTSIMHILNREIIIVDLLQALVGSLAILLTIPLTVVVCCIMYTKKVKKIKGVE